MMPGPILESSFNTLRISSRIINKIKETSAEESDFLEGQSTDTRHEDNSGTRM